MERIATGGTTILKNFNFIRQHTLCVSLKQAEHDKAGVWQCVRWGGECRLKKCENVHKQLAPQGE